MGQTRMVDTSHGAIALRDTESDGLPVLMIHGNSSSGAIFRNQLKGPLGRRFRLIAPDLPGHGDSADAMAPERTYRMEGYAEAMVELLSLLGIERAGVFGWSLGGHIGLEMISRYPGLLGLMITGTPPVNTATVGQGFIPSPHMGLAGQEVFTPEDVETYARHTCGEPFEPFLLDVVARTDGRARRMMFEAFVAGTGDDQEAIVATSGLPLAVVNGKDEPFVDLAHVASRPYANLWEGRTIAIDHSGHAPFWDRADAFDPIFERFFASLSAR
ncbi:alpha/beta hydrolase [Aureimonas endophytica]|uniref:Alpha/beta hydrolase n=1 Tax=Aureimonas endophytica TaxID=2027858 RepID=A0A916ZMJ6_9HYPH|nr:alpha/beta hydrolase [Aureimonas endophytica]GGE03991.1 alpha/beta hydrolase [Aureimonas endophytica]